MTTDIIAGNWKQLKGKVKQQWGKLTDDEVTQMEGSFDELSGKIQEKYGYQKQQAEKEINDFIEKNKDNH